MLPARWLSVVAAAAAATTAVYTSKTRIQRCTTLLPFFFQLLLLLSSLSPAPAAAGGPASGAATTHEERAINLDANTPGSEYVLGSSHEGSPRGTPSLETQHLIPDNIFLDVSALKRNEFYGEGFVSYTEELRSLWQKCQQDNAAVATVRTNVDDFIGFAACAELNLELDEVWVDTAEGQAQLGYKWLLYPKEAVGTDIHLRRAVSRSEARLLKISQLVQKASLEAAEAGLPITQGTSMMLGRLMYKSIVIQDKKIITYPEITVGTDSELCGLILLRSLLKRAQAFGLVEVRLRVESSNIPLLKAASCTGFRPVSMLVHQSRAHHVFVANPQLPLPAVSELKQKIATLGEEEEAAVDGPYKERGLREPQESAAVDLEKLYAPALLTGVGAILLVVFASFMWRRRKAAAAAAAAVSGGPRRSSLQMRSGGWGGPPNNIHLRYQDDRYLSPPPHWRDRQQNIESIHESLSSEESEEWKATGQLDG
ncbi:hypothetical protein Emed_002619 [Eimeria media]